MPWADYHIPSYQPACIRRDAPLTCTVLASGHSHVYHRPMPPWGSESGGGGGVDSVACRSRLALVPCCLFSVVVAIVIIWCQH